jgi:hypothetical protein
LCLNVKDAAEALCRVGWLPRKHQGDFAKVEAAIQTMVSALITKNLTRAVPLSPESRLRGIFQSDLERNNLNVSAKPSRDCADQRACADVKTGAEAGSEAAA